MPKIEKGDAATATSSLPQLAAINDPNNPTIEPAVKPVESEVLEEGAVEVEPLAAPKLPDLDLAGVYVVKHGSYKLGSKTYAAGTKLKLSSNDAVRALIEKVVEPADSKTKMLVADKQKELSKLHHERHTYSSPLARGVQSI